MKRRNKVGAKRFKTARGPVGRPRGKRKSKDQVREQMLSILLRGRGETLGEACERVGVSVQTYYHRLRSATFGSESRGKPKKVSLSAVEARRLGALIRRQERLQRALSEFQRMIR